MHSTIVSIDELAAHLGDPKWVIVDCRHLLQDHGAGRRLYDAVHIPGAHFVSAENDLSGPKTGKNGRHPMPDPERFAQLLRDLGVHPDTQLVAYDSGNDGFAARFWFLARYVGHDPAAVLDGGFAAWAGTGKRISTDEPARPGNGTLQAKPRTHTAVNADDVAESLEKKHFTLIDARGADRYAGQNETIDPVGGHIPGAINRPFRANFNGPFGTYKTAEKLRTEFEALGVDPEKIVHQCGSGVTAAANLLAMEIAGLRGARLYPGSWSEWCSDPSRPMTRGS